MGERGGPALGRTSRPLLAILGLLLSVGSAFAAGHAPSGSVAGGPSVASDPPTAPSLSGVAGASLPVATGWTMYHGDPFLDGRASSGTPAHPALLWSDPLPLDTGTPPGPGSTEHPYQSSPVVEGSKVFVTSNDVLYLLNGTTGAIAQSVDLLGPMGDGPLVSTPLVLPGGQVAVAQDGGSNNVGVANPATGAVPTVCGFNGNPFASSPAPMPRGQLLVADDAGNVNAINLANGNCGVAAFNKAGGGPSYRATPAVAYVPGKGWEAIVSDYGSGHVDIWAAPGGGAPTSITLPPTVTNLWGSVAVANITNGTQTLPVGFVADEVGAGSTSLLWILNLSSNAPYPTTMQMLSGPGLDSGVEGTVAVVDRGGASADVFLGNDTGSLAGFEFDDAGRGSWTPLWSFSAGAGAQFVASPVYARGSIVDGATNGWIYDVNATTGALAWKMYLGSPIYTTPAVSGGSVYAFTSAGAVDDLSLASPPVMLVPPSPSSSGSTTPVFVWVGAINTTGTATGNLPGASVTLTTTGGTVLGPNPMSTNATGWAEFNWSTPGGLTSSINCTLSASVVAAGYGSGGATALGEVDPAGPPPPPPVLFPMHVQAASGLADVLLGQTTWVSVSATASGGAALAGAAVQLTLTGAGSLASTFGTTAGNGTFWTVYTAPAVLPPNPGVLLGVNVSARGYFPAQNATALELLSPAGSQLPVLSVGLSPSTAISVAQGGTVAFQVSVSNGSSLLFPPVAGATASIVWNPSSSGAFSGSGPTGASGMTYYNFTSSATASGSVLAMIQVSAPGYVPASKALAIAILPPSSTTTPPPALSISPSFTSSSFVPGTGTTLVVTVLSTGNTVQGAWVNVSVIESGNVLTTVSPSTAISSVSGVASFTLSWDGSPQQTVTLRIEASGTGYTSAWTNVTVTLQPPPGQSTPVTNGFPLSMLDLLLLALTLAFAVAFVAALTRRRPSDAEMAQGNLDEEAPTPPPDIVPPTDPGAPPDLGPELGPQVGVPPAEFDEEAESTGPTADPGTIEEVDRPGPPGQEPPVREELESSSSSDEDVSSEEASPVLLEDEGGGREEAPAAEEPGSGGRMHVELERTLGEERPDVEESNPYRERLSPEDVNPNVRRIPKKLLQPAEMRIKQDQAEEEEQPAATPSAPAPTEPETSAEESPVPGPSERPKRMKKVIRSKPPASPPAE